MDFVTRLLFEDLAVLLLASAGATAVALGIHRRQFTSRSRRNVWITLATCAGLITLQYLVNTDREKVEALVRNLVVAVDATDMDAIATAFDRDGVALGAGDPSESFPHETFIQAIRLGLQDHEIDEARTTNVRVRITGDQATVEFSVTCDLSDRSGLQGRRPSFWELHCVHRPEGWKLDHVVSGNLGLEGIGPAVNVINRLERWCAFVTQTLDP